MFDKLKKILSSPVQYGLSSFDVTLCDNGVKWGVLNSDNSDLNVYGEADSNVYDLARAAEEKLHAMYKGKLTCEACYAPTEFVHSFNMFGKERKICDECAHDPKQALITGLQWGVEQHVETEDNRNKLEKAFASSVQ
jgi:hypothetical protein